MTGLLNDDDTITLFRNTDETQFFGQNQRGVTIQYQGNNFESWSTNPGLKYSDGATPKLKVLAKVPLYACVASCIGRERGFMFKDNGECEIMVCGSLVKNVIIVGDLRGIKIPGVREEYLSQCKSNMENFVNKYQKGNGSINGSLLTARLEKIAQNILYGLFR